MLLVEMEIESLVGCDDELICVGWCKYNLEMKSVNEEDEYDVD